MAPMITASSEALEKVRELIRDIRVGMLTTVTPDGTLRSRPMMNVQAEFDGELWFFTGWESGKVHDVLRDAHVNVAFARPEESRYVSISGTATIVRDRAKGEELWNSLVQAWFPRGLDDPGLALLKVTVASAEYWDAPAGKMVEIAGFLKAIATGRQYEATPGEHGQVRL